MDALKFGELKVYRDDNRLGLSLEVAFLGREDNELDKFRILSVKCDCGYYSKPVSKGQYLNLLTDQDVYLFSEAEGDLKQSLENTWNDILEEEKNSPFKFSGKKYEKCEATTKKMHGNPFFSSYPHLLHFSPVEGSEIKAEFPSGLKDPERYAYEQYPEYFFGCSIYKDFPGGNFTLVAVPSYYCDLYQTDDQLEALLSYGKEKGWDTSKVEDMINLREENERNCVDR